jgi:hypothetical protein
MGSRFRAARHARPTGRAALEQALVESRAELGQVRSQRYGAELEIVRLTALVEMLSTETVRLNVELADVRREIAQSRRLPSGPDPLVALFAGQAADLRAVLAEQQAQMSVLTARLIDLMTVTHWPPEMGETEGETAEAETGEGSVVSLASVGGRERLQREAEVDQALGHSAPAGLHDLRGPAQPLSSARRDGGGTVEEDQTVLRLRMIRQAFDG